MTGLATHWLNAACPSCGNTSPDGWSALGGSPLFFTAMQCRGCGATHTRDELTHQQQLSPGTGDPLQPVPGTASASTGTPETATRSTREARAHTESDPAPLQRPGSRSTTNQP